MPSSAGYWRERDRQNATRLYEYSDNQARMVTRWFDRAAREMDEKVLGFYRRYADDNGLTLPQAKAILNDPAAIQKLLDDYERMVSLYPDDPVAKRLLDGLYSARAINRERYLKLQLNLIATDVFGKYKSATTKTLTTLFEESYYKSMFDYQQYVGFGSSFNRLNTNFIAAATGTAWSGRNYSETIWGVHRVSLARYLNRIVTTGAIEGKPARLMTAELQKAMDASAYNARRLIRTESSYVANRGSLYSYEQNGTERFKFLATLDFKTSEKCRSMDGQSFAVSEAQPGENVPPLHPFCRSTTVPDVLGDEDDTRAARSGSGETYRVPADMTYREWYDKHVAPYKEELLAEQKYKNGASDTEQWKRYREVLGKDVPSSLDKFQNMKYTDIDGYDSLKQQYRHTSYYNTHLTHEEQTAVNAYIGGGSIVLNAKLRDSEPLNEAERDLVYHLDAALEKMPVFEGPVNRSIIVERDVKYSLAMQAYSGTLRFASYTSSSTLTDYHEKPNVYMRLHSKTGRDLRSINKSEQEILFRRDSRFKVLELNHTDGVLMIVAEEIE